MITQLEQLATAGLQPDLCLWLELSPEVAAERRSGQQQDRIEAEGLPLARVHQGFAELSQRPGWRRVDASASLSRCISRCSSWCVRVWSWPRE